jgi:hypothetical protein
MCKYWVVLNPWVGGMYSYIHFHYCPQSGSFIRTKPAIFWLFVVFCSHPFNELDSFKDNFSFFNAVAVKGLIKFIFSGLHILPFLYGIWLLSHEHTVQIPISQHICAVWSGSTLFALDSLSYFWPKSNQCRSRSDSTEEPADLDLN